MGGGEEVEREIGLDLVDRESTKLIPRHPPPPPPPPHPFHSNEKSRRLAAENYSLPERLDHLMRLRKEKLERERSKLAQDVVKEVTVSRA